jgi:hypothetical protein
MFGISWIDWCRRQSTGRRGPRSSGPHLETPGKLTRILIHLHPITVLIVLSSEDVDEGKIQINKGELLRAC